MRVYGVDFTSAPGRSKPIAVAECELDGDRLAVRDLLRLKSFEQLERGLERPGPWVAGMDFPFGQPRRLVRDLGWPESWEGHVRRVAEMTRSEWGDLLEMYRAARPRGDKEHLRATDRRAGAKAPMKWSGVPLARMFYEGAPRLLRTPLDLRPCRPTGDSRTVLEVYPALVARHLIAKRPYKEGKRSQNLPGGARREARRKLVEALRSPRLAEGYGVTVEIGRFLAAGAVDDPRGDLVDAVLAAIQAAWGWRRKDEGFGIPPEADPDEGWIVDPATARAPTPRPVDRSVADSEHP